VAEFQAQVEMVTALGYQAVLPREILLAKEGKLRLPDKPIVFSFDDGLQSVGDQALAVLDQAGFRAVVYVVSSQIGGHNAWDTVQGLPYQACMDEGALRRILHSGWEIGSHGTHHKDLTKLTRGELAEEIYGSKRDLEARFGAIDSFCYPYGAQNEAVRQMVVDAEYTNAMAVQASTRLVTADLFVMKRVFIKGGDALPTFRRKISGLNLLFRSLRKV
jgi:peptidoglycan/xylan/chitin deacetylase (PgdA/CDA1 family)